MTAALDIHPDAGHPAWVLVAGVRELLETHGSDVGAPLVAGEYAGLVTEMDRVITRLQAVKLQILASADTADVAAGSGLSGTGAWFAKHTRTASVEAAGQVALATALDTLPATQDALSAGEVSADHAAVIAHATRRLPTTLDADQRARVEEKVVAQARTLDPVALRKKARQALIDITTRAEAEAHHDQVLRDEEARARAKTRLTLHDNRDGTTTGHFTVPTLAGSILRKVDGSPAAPGSSRSS